MDLNSHPRSRQALVIVHQLLAVGIPSWVCPVKCIGCPLQLLIVACGIPASATTIEKDSDANAIHKRQGARTLGLFYYFDEIAHLRCFLASQLTAPDLYLIPQTLDVLRLGRLQSHSRPRLIPSLALRYLYLPTWARLALDWPSTLLCHHYSASHPSKPRSLIHSLRTTLSDRPLIRSETTFCYPCLHG